MPRGGSPDAPAPAGDGRGTAAECAIDFRHLRYFVAVAEEGTFGRASLRLRVAQPALSKQIHDLEREIGAQLLVRGARGVSPTRAGAELLAHARPLLASVSQARETVFQVRDRAPVVRVGLPETWGTRRAVRGAAEAFRAARAGARVRLVALPLAEQGGAVAAGALDVGWRFGAPEEAGVEGVPFETLEIDHAAVPEGHAAAASGVASLAGLADLPLHAARRTAGAAGTDQAIARARAAGWAGEVLESGELSGAALRIAAGEGWCLVPRGAGVLLPAGLVVLPLAEGAMARWEVHLLRRAGEDRPPVLELLALLASRRDGPEADPGKR